MTKQMQVMCNVDLYKGDIKACKWYNIEVLVGGMFGFYDDSGEYILGLLENCSHLESNPRAFWSLRVKPNETNL